MSYVHPNEPEDKAEYNDQDAATLYSWAMETVVAEEKETLLQVAAQKGSDEAKYALYWMESTKPGVEPSTQAFTYLVDCADSGDWVVQFQVAQIYAGKVVMLGIKPNPRKALSYYEKARESSWQAYQEKPGDLARYYFCAACVHLADTYLSGRGTVIREDKAFNFTKRVAYLGSRCAELAKYYLKGIRTDVNANEAYIWALIEIAKYLTNTPNDEIILLLNQINPPAKAEDRITLQKEACRRLNIIRERPLTDDDVAEPGKAQFAELPENSSPFSNWNVQNAKAITIILNYGDHDKSMVIKHKEKGQLRFKINELFRDNLISLLVKHYQVVHEGREAILPDGFNVAYGNSRRKNHQIVSDFNTRFRDLMGHKGDKDFKAFEWIGKAKSTRSLKANIHIEVYI